MMRPSQLLMTVVATLALATSAHATVDEFGEFYIPYRTLQSGEVCMSRQIMSASYGIPLAAMMKGIFSPTRTLEPWDNGQDQYININDLAQGSTRIAYAYNFDRYTNDNIVEYSFTLNLAAYNTRNGQTTAGRQKTRDTAKLALIAMMKTSELLHGAGKFRLWVKFDNLPPQHGLTGSALSAGGTDWPSWPYTSGSSTYRTYTQEMLARHCRV